VFRALHRFWYILAPANKNRTANRATNWARWWTGLYLGLVWLVAGFVALPVGVVLGQGLISTSDRWQHLAQTVLPGYLLNSLGLMVGVGLGAGVTGIGTAWCMVFSRFPGQGWLEWALLLPLAIPAYVLAYTYTDFLDVAGPLQGSLRQVTGWEVGQYWFPPIRSLGGAIAMLTLALYPYVYMLAKVAFTEQARNTLEASRTLGCNPAQSFWQVALPLARPAIGAGLALVLMEALSDFGTVQYFGVDTFTTGIYRTWAGMGDPVAATQLAALLLGVILLLIWVEQGSRGRARYYQLGASQGADARFVLRGWPAIAACVGCGLPLVLGFVLPVGLLLAMALTTPGESLNGEFLVFARHSLSLALVSTLVMVAIATTLAYGLRLYHQPLLNYGAKLAIMGYAIPGSVIAVGISIPLGWLAELGNRGAIYFWGVDPRWVFSGTVAALVFAYVVRFLAVSFNAVDSSLAKIAPSLDDAARSLGYLPAQILQQVHVPLLGRGLLTAAILAFVDVIKELPATLMIRPFNFDTLAIRVYRLAADERLAEAAGAALAIVLVGLVPVLILSQKLLPAQPRATSTPLDRQF
jgi:iron(III) transport system permease protein